MSLADFEAEMAELRRSMEAELGERVAGIETLPLAELRREAHRIRGGFSARRKLTELAGRVEKLAAEGDEEAARRAAVLLAEEARSVAANAKTASLSIAPAPTESRARLVVVDDDPQIRRMLQLTLERSGQYDVEAFADGVAVLSRLQQATPTIDLIIADAMMPELGGMELARLLRERAPEIPVVVLSAATPEELGFSDEIEWWRKPLKRRELLARVEAQLALKRRCAGHR